MKPIQCRVNLQCVRLSNLIAMWLLEVKMCFVPYIYPFCLLQIITNTSLFQPSHCQITSSAILLLFIVFIRILPHVFSPSHMCYVGMIYIMTLFSCCIGNICLTKMSFLCTVKWGMTFILKCIQDEKFCFNSLLVDKI